MQWHLILIEALALNNAPTLSAFPTGARRFFNYSCLCDKRSNTLANSPRSCFPADGTSNRPGAAFGQELCGNFAFVAAAAIAVRCAAGRVRWQPCASAYADCYRNCCDDLIFEQCISSKSRDNGRWPIACR
jgi:hypothetical protein